MDNRSWMMGCCLFLAVPVINQSACHCYPSLTATTIWCYVPFIGHIGNGIWLVAILIGGKQLMNIIHRRPFVKTWLSTMAAYNQSKSGLMTMSPCRRTVRYGSNKVYGYSQQRTKKHGSGTQLLEC